MEQALASVSPPVSAEDHSIGSPDARVTLVQYAEFECPHCGRAYFQLKLLRDHLADLDARFVFRHFAHDEVHPYSVRAAIAAEAADEQGRFWEMHDHLFENQHSLEYEDLERHAQAVGLDAVRFMSDLRDPRLRERIETSRADARKTGVNGTPSFFINGVPYAGSYALSALLRAIEAAA